MQPLGTVKEDDTVSMYVFGEDEDKLQNEASRNGGYLNYEHLANHFGGQHVPAVRKICFIYISLVSLLTLRI